MGRQARRAQARAERRQQRQQARPGATRAPSISAPPAPGEARRQGSLLKPRWALDIISELRKVTWPTRGEVSHLTIVVIVISALAGLVLGAADLAFGWLIEQWLQ